MCELELSLQRGFIVEEVASFEAFVRDCEGRNGTPEERLDALGGVQVELEDLKAREEVLRD